VDSKSTILTSDSKIIASKCLENKKRGGIIECIKGKELY